MTLSAIVAISAVVLTSIKIGLQAVNLTVYAKPTIEVITSTPSYISEFIAMMQNFLPPYIIIPFLAMVGVLVSYLICHLFAQFIDRLPG